MANSLFDSFNPVSSKQWKQKIQFELDGADYNQSVIWNSPEDIQVKPFYHKDEFKNKYSVTTKVTSFTICQNIFVYDIQKSTERAIETLNRGAESIRFTIENTDLDIEKLLTPIPLTDKIVYFNLNFISIDFVNQLQTIAISKKATFFINNDPIGYFARKGNWLNTTDKNNFDTLENLSKTLKNSNLLSVDATLYQNAGANIVQQIAYSLAHSCEYFNRIPSYQQTIVFEVSIGSNYFFEIAKLRALRLLFNLIVKEFNTGLKCHILATPSKRNKTIYDYNVNMLRTTTECMSAILGGADSIANLAYDSLYHKDNEFGDRIARNQLLILKDESYFDKVNNPTDGSYYIESLTAQLAEKSLNLFKEIESNGGFLKLLNEGNIKKKIQESADKEQALFDSKNEVLVGTNKFANSFDRMKNNLELFPFVKIKPRKTLIKPIIEKRLAEKIEQYRLETEE